MRIHNPCYSALPEFIQCPKVKIEQNLKFFTASQRKYTLAAVALVVVALWAGYTAAKRAYQRRPHADIAGPAAVKANADQLGGTVVTPHLECEITPGKNVLWCATFQIAWNEACDLLGGPIQWTDAPEMVSVLNKRIVTRRDLDETSYVAVAGYVTQDSDDIRQTITHELDRKFKGTASPELLHLLDSVPAGMWAAYAYLFEELPFNWAFTRMHRGLEFAGRQVDNFGISQFLEEQKNERRAASQVLIYDYRDNDDFIIELKTRSKADRLVLAKIPPGRTLAETVATVQRRIQQSKPGSMQNCANLFIPVIDFDVLRSYDEVTGGGSPCAVALQQIRFKLNERGAVLKSEALIAKGLARQDLVFDKPFLVMIQRTDASQPYFALWVANAELLVPFHETSSNTSSSVK